MVELLGSSVQIEGAVKCFQDLTAALNLHKKKAMLAQQVHSLTTIIFSSNNIYHHYCFPPSNTHTLFVALYITSDHVLSRPNSLFSQRPGEACSTGSPIHPYPHSHSPYLVLFIDTTVHH